jgi:hypothetical protein
MFGPVRPAGGVGLLLIVTGGLLTCYLLAGDGLPRALPSVLIGLSLMAFGLSMMRSDRRRHGGRRRG